MCSKIISQTWNAVIILTLACGTGFAQDGSSNDLLGTWQSSVGYETLILVFHSSTQLEFDGRRRAILWPVMSFGSQPQSGSNSADAALITHFTGIWVTNTKNTQTKAYLAPDGTYYQNYEASYSGGANTISKVLCIGNKGSSVVKFSYLY